MCKVVYEYGNHNTYSTHNVVSAIDNIDKLHMYLLHYNSGDAGGCKGELHTGICQGCSISLPLQWPWPALFLAIALQTPWYHSYTNIHQMRPMHNVVLRCCVDK